MSGTIDNVLSVALISASMKLSEYLEAKGIKQQDFADLVGCTQGRISQLIAGETPSLELAQKIAASTKGKVGLDDWGKRAA